MKTRVLTCLALIACASLVFPLYRTSAAAPDSATSQLQIIGKDGKVTGFVPLKHTAIKTEISGFVARITVTQQFENVLPQAIEAVYVFPLPHESAVDGMTMRIGDREIQGVIHERDEARRIYEQARNTGHTAALLDQERPNIFTQSVTNIPPNARVDVTLSVIEMLKYEAGTYEFVFPLVVGPRYIPGAPAAAPAQGTMADTDQVPDASKISPPVAGVHTGDPRAGHDVSIEVNLAAGVYVTAVNSDSHKIAAERTGPDSFHVQLADDAVLPKKDFVLKYKVAGAGITDAVLAHADQSGGYFTLILQPPDRVPDSAVVPREMIFVLDTSGSMWGFPLEMAKKTIRRALDNLRPDETFNLITFSGDTRILFREPVPASQENVAAAKKVLAGAYGSGGTEMMKAIRTALGDDAGQGRTSDVARVRVVCFMTDGYVGNDAEIVAEVQKHPEARVFAFGIGTAVNRFLLSKMAEEGHGEVEFVTAPGEAQPAADRFYERVHSPVLTNISIEWNGLPVEEVYPAQVRDLFAAKPIILTGRYTQAAQGTVVIRGMRAGGPFERALRVDFPEASPDHAVLEKIWARRKVEDYMSQDWLGIQQGQSAHKAEIIKVGLEHSLATQYTSFVAVETKTVVQDGKPVRVEVPVELPEGVSPLAVPGGQFSEHLWARTGFSNTNGSVALSISTPPPPSPGGSYGYSSTVEVSADAPMIETNSAQVATTFSGVLLHGPEGAIGGSSGIAGPDKAKAREKALESKLSPELLTAWRCMRVRSAGTGSNACRNAASGTVKVKVSLLTTNSGIVQKLASAGLKVESGAGSTTVIGTIDVARLNQLAKIAEVVSVGREK
ncbi:MAG: VWA domain-containing protein [Acidobacteriia bacterium]|nr:VWA domain-containing protein [Terriglobia bacterium]